MSINLKQLGTRAFAVVGLCTAGTACTPTLDWRDTTFPDADGLTALFPCKPDRAVRTLPLAGRQVTLALASCQAGDATFALAHADMVDPALVEPALVELRAAIARNLGGTVESVAASTVRGSTPNPQSQRVTIAGPSTAETPGRATVQFFVHGTRVHQATVLGLPKQKEGTETFLDSFHFGR